MLRGKLHAELDRLLSGMYTAPDNARLAKLLRKHRESVLRSLDHDGVDATNNLAEREVRQAVIARKVSAGNRTEAGAEAHAVLASVLRTLCRQGRPILEGLTVLLSHGSSSSHAHRVTHIDPVTKYSGVKDDCGSVGRNTKPLEYGAESTPSRAIP